MIPRRSQIIPKQRTPIKQSSAFTGAFSFPEGGEMKHAVFCATRNLYADMEAAAKSLVANSDVDKVHFLIEDPEFPRPLPGIVECHDVSGQGFFSSGGPNARTGWTYMILMRAALCHILPDVDKVLSLDCDAFCVRDTSCIWDVDLDGKYFAGVAERAKSEAGKPYVNFGVVLFNLDEMRDGKADEIIEALNRKRFKFPEQDAMNQLCNGRIVELPTEFNAMSFNANLDSPRIVHYAGVKREKWHANPEARLYLDMTWDEAMELHDTAAYNGRPVLFTSDHKLERAENLRAVWGAYKYQKEFRQGSAHMSEAARQGYAAVVCDTLPRWIPDKGDCKSIILGHGIIGKKYALDEKRDGIDKRAIAQIDAAICPSEGIVDIMARQFDLPSERVFPLGFPRTDQYVGAKKGDGGTFLTKYRRAYLYAPTLRWLNDGGHLARIDWGKLDSLLEDDEIVVVKRHYFQKEPIVLDDVEKIVEVVPKEPSAAYVKDCDVLVTDYSSIVVDGYLAGKPSVLVVDDMDEYLSTRGMNLDFPDEYGSRVIVAEGNEEELLSMMREAAENGMGDIERAFMRTVAGMCDGNSAKRVCDLIESML